MRASPTWVVAACVSAIATTQSQAQVLPITNALSQASAFEDAYGTGRWVDGGYQIAARQGLTRWFWYNGYLPSNTRISLTTTLRGGPNGQGWGITFGRPSRETAQWANFLIDADGHYKVVKWGGDDAIPWRMTSAINTGIGARNEMAIVINGQQLTFFVNGQQIDSYMADRDPSGYIGLEISQGMEVRFEAMSATAAGGAIGAMPVSAGGGKGVAAAPTPTSISVSSALLWADDFSGFSAVDDEIAASEYRDGGLMVNSRQGMTRWLFGRGLAPSNVRISVNAQFKGGPSNVRFGFAFGRPSRDERAWMAFDVTGDGQYYLEGYGAANNLGPSPSPAVMRGYNSINQLTAEVRGTQVTLYVNGQFVGAYTASRDAAGYVGVHANAGAQVLFSNLRVERLN